MQAVRQFCPLCDRALDAAICPTHSLPTISLPEEEPEQNLALSTGTIIGARFRVERFIGQGGMGVVLAATDLDGDRPAVIKLIRGERAMQRSKLRRFYQEAWVISRLAHPSIVRVLGFGFDEPTRLPYLAMELALGRTLREVLNDEGPMPERRAVLIALQVSSALEAAHENRILHRDLKPENIKVEVSADGATDTIKVLDFGIAKLLDADDVSPPMTLPGQVIGTPAFMAPEQIVQGPQDERTDLYGLGSLLHVMLTGHPPFLGKESREIVEKKLREPAPPLPDRLVDGAVPHPRLIALHRALLATSRLERPATTSEVVKTLREITADAAATELLDVAVPPAQPSAQPSARSGWRALLGTAALLAMAAMGLLYFGTGVEPAPVAGAQRKQITLETEPAGAVVYDGAQVIGVTPLVVSLTRARLLRLEKKGYEDFVLPADLDSLERVRVVLIAEQVETKEEPKRKPVPKRAEPVVPIW